MANGLSNQEIADELILALGTVAKYSNNIFTKLNVRNRTQAIARAQALGLVKVTIEVYASPMTIFRASMVWIKIRRLGFALYRRIKVLCLQYFLEMVS